MTQKAKTTTQPRPSNRGFKPPPVLKRTTFSTSRTMDFFSEKELVTQTGHDRTEWPLVFLKECIDNALDACDEAELAPTVTVRCGPDGIEVADNGPGLPEATLQRQQDFTIRASNREAYQAPDRGAQGNAIKTLLPMPSIVDPDHGLLVIAAHGKRHEIRCTADHVSQQPVIRDNVTDQQTAGTTFRMQWLPKIVEQTSWIWPFGRSWLIHKNEPTACNAYRIVHNLIAGFAVFNPHLTIRLDWFNHVTEHAATNTAFQKWKPCQPTSAHWYDQAQLERLVGAYITDDRQTGRDRLVSEFVAEFDGLTGSAKRTAVLEACGLKRAKLSCLVADGDFDHAAIHSLLIAMKANSKHVTPKRLGFIGQDHFKTYLTALGCVEETIEYRRAQGKHDDLHIVEVAFGKHEDDTFRRQLIAGANWSAAIKNPFRSFGATGEGLEGFLANQFSGSKEPIVVAVHLAAPRVRYADRGKSSIVVNGTTPNDEGKVDDE